ncbi:VOC family protein [Vibrio sp. S4M6]|uniref:VOC family protein n=1 Tax=Vibrio sinus TaxID=2946865 RepID=UPI00202A9B2F|nr:VOC family protein [Vibrio sinus]MCL9782651.1 VOC family protein [Vibrio sinus]
MQSNPIVWFEIYVDDITRAKQFYETVLNVSLEALQNPTNMALEMWGFPSNQDGYGATGALVKMKDIPAGGNSTLVYFSCEDCSVEASRVEAAGGVLQAGKFPIGEHGFIAIATDTEGNTIGLHSMT